jgi:type II secretory pathway component PulC
MRRTLLASLLAFGLPLLANADETVAPVEPAPVPVAAPAVRPAHLVGVILSSAQALLWDDERGEYVLHRVGDDAFGGRLVELDADHVVIERGEAREVMELSAPPQMRVAGKRQPKRLPAMFISAAPEREAVAAVAPAPVAAPAFVAAPAPVVAPALVAPPTSTEIALAPAPVVAPALAPAPTAVPALAPAPTAVPALAPAPTAVPVLAPAPTAVPAAAPAGALPPVPVVAPPLPPSATGTVATPVTPSAPATAAVAPAVTADRRPVAAMLIPRADLDRELGDFASLSQDVQVSQQPEGGFRLAAVRSGSFFERIGLRANDVVVRVDGRTIKGIDDASAAYAWLRVTNKFSVEVLREGRPLTLRYVISQPMTASSQ